MEINKNNTYGNKYVYKNAMLKLPPKKKLPTIKNTPNIKLIFTRVFGMAMEFPRNSDLRLKPQTPNNKIKKLEIP